MQRYKDQLSHGRNISSIITFSKRPIQPVQQAPKSATNIEQTPSRPEQERQKSPIDNSKMPEDWEENDEYDTDTTLVDSQWTSAESSEREDDDDDDRVEDDDQVDDYEDVDGEDYQL